MTKKIILLTIICTTTLLSPFGYADLTYRFVVPKPDFISDDWDNDGLKNNVDPDDDNDGILDIDDSTPFDRGGQNSVPNVLVNSFSVTPVSYFAGDSITLSWDIYNIRTLSLYNDPLLTNFLGDVSNQNSITLNPNGDVTYYLDTETSIEEKSVFQYNQTSKTCGSWSPDPSTVNKGTSFTQNRNCTINYASNEPSTTSKNQKEYQTNIGTKIVVVCKYDAYNKIQYTQKDNTSNSYLGKVDIKINSSIIYTENGDFGINPSSGYNNVPYRFSIGNYTYYAGLKKGSFNLTFDYEVCKETN